MLANAMVIIISQYNVYQINTHTLNFYNVISSLCISYKKFKTKINKMKTGVQLKLMVSYLQSLQDKR